VQECGTLMVLNGACYKCEMRHQRVQLRAARESPGNQRDERHPPEPYQRLHRQFQPRRAAFAHRAVAAARALFTS
jgi:hypothetical protein